jgi:hypothetical protein
MTTPYRQVRAAFTDHGITVYQAYPPHIANPAVRAGTFVAPFKRERMTWIKPSFRWMGYRSGWASKPNQERILAVTISRAGFEWALRHACLSHFDADLYPDEATWRARKEATPVRIQWDPERDLHFTPLDHRSLQIGLTGPAVAHYLDDWITTITDVTDQARTIHALLDAGDLDAATAALPTEHPYPLPSDIHALIGAG